MENLTPKLWYHVWLDGDAARAVVNVQELADRLPHGSGIDGDWFVTVRRNGDIGLTAEYHSMDENGSYCGWRTLKASIVKVRKDELHPLGTPGFVQILHKKGDIVLKTASNGGDNGPGDWFHECLAEDLKSLVVGIGGQSIHEATGKPAVWSREDGGWTIAPEGGR